MIVQWSPGVTLEEIERQTIIAAMNFYHQNKTQVSISLGISIRTLDTRLEKYEQDKAQFDARQAADRQRDADHLKRARGAYPYTTTEYESAGILGARSGVLVEPAKELPAEQSVSVPQRQQVQEVLPRHASQGGNGKRR